MNLVTPNLLTLTTECELSEKSTKHHLKISQPKRLIKIISKDKKKIIKHTQNKKFKTTKSSANQLKIRNTIN